MKRTSLIIVGVGILGSAAVIFNYCCNERESILNERVLRWREAVEAGDVKTAVQSARDIVGTIQPSSLPPRYEKLCRKNGVDPEFLKTDFNALDFQLWKHALFFHKLVYQIAADTHDEQSEIEALLAAVRKRIEPVEPQKENILWPYTIWQLQKGVCDRQAWVLCELAYQLGYEAQIVYLRNPNTLVSPHTVCEIRKERNTWVADPYSGRLLPDVSVADIAADRRLAASTWPEREDWQKAVSKSAYWLPAYPQDYCKRNQELYSEVKAVLGESCPRFGESPEDRLNRYLSLTSREDRLFPYRFWFYPFRLLNKQMAAVRKMKTRRQNDPANLNSAGQL